MKSFHFSRFIRSIIILGLLGPLHPTLVRAADQEAEEDATLRELLHNARESNRRAQAHIAQTQQRVREQEAAAEAARRESEQLERDRDALEAEAAARHRQIEEEEERHRDEDESHADHAPAA